MRAGAKTISNRANPTHETYFIIWGTHSEESNDAKLTNSNSEGKNRGPSIGLPLPTEIRRKLPMKRRPTPSLPSSAASFPPSVGLPPQAPVCTLPVKLQSSTSPPSVGLPPPRRAPPPSTELHIGPLLPAKHRAPRRHVPPCRALNHLWVTIFFSHNKSGNSTSSHVEDYGNNTCEVFGEVRPY